MPLRAREIEQRRAELVLRDDAQVDLRAAARDDAGLRVAADEHALDDVHRHERLHDGRGLGRGDDDVDVADRLGEAAQRPAVRRVRDAGHVDGGARRCARRAGGRPRSACDRARPAPRGARAPARASPRTSAPKPLSVAHLLLRERLAQIVERRHAELGAQLVHRLRARAPGCAGARRRWRGASRAAPRASSTLPPSRSSRILSAVLLPMPSIFCSSLTVSLPRSVACASIACAALS